MSAEPKHEQLHRDSLVMVAHDHRPISSDLQAMQAGGVTAKVFQVTLDVDVQAGLRASMEKTDGWRDLARQELSAALADIESNRDRCILARTAVQIEDAKRHGQVAIVLGTEGGRWMEGDTLDIADFPKLEAHRARMKDRPAVQRALAEEQAG